ncbi:MAG: polymerase subunit delta [Solirubrobacteraceae bacterium]|nr:polymerase subunit delta [Solirubrobacteraceae bacterium]
MVTVPLAGTEHHPHAAAVLGAALPPHGRPSHAYLFGGPAGAGKRTVARAFAAALLAEGAADPDAVRGRVERGSHPDLTWVTPSGAHELLVGDIDSAVVGAAARTPFEARRRVFVIERADTMIEQAANKMLKTLEEPPPFAHLILLSDRPGEVLPTIASRCQHVRFEALPEDEVVARLGRDGVEPQPARAAARLARGDARLARELATGGGPKLRVAAQRFARAAPAAEMGERPWRELLAQARARADAAAAELDERHAGVLELTAKRDRRRADTEHAERSRRLARRVHTETLDLQLALVGLWYRDLLCVALDTPDLAANVDREAELAADAAGRDPTALRRALELVDDTRQRLPLNVTEELACEALGYRLEHLLAA